ncbi:MAG: Epoxyqueuosine reductase QueH [Candidatus Omnitrophica bacterium]|nr:Epoxyqueuosine reductase QueH [Candidatus Omnitrophota bacterium]
MSPIQPPPDGEKKVLLHSCCAPCSGSVIQDIHEAGVELTVYFYNPNIHPRKEYELRKEENIRYAAKVGIPFVDADYDAERWFEITKGHENDGERSERCSLCFEMRFVKTAEYAANNGYKWITSCLGISRWKDIDQITREGIKAASLFPGVRYWEHNWRKNDGSKRMIDIAKEERFYAQQYCGCAYSLRDTNRFRASQGRPAIELGKDYYEPGVSARQKWARPEGDLPAKS